MVELPEENQRLEACRRLALGLGVPAEVAEMPSTSHFSDWQDPDADRPEGAGAREERCPAGLPPAVCCVGHPWDVANLGDQVREWGEPLPQSVIDAAVRHGIEPHVLHDHVEGEHGWEPHDKGYDEAVELLVRCVRVRH